MPVVVCGPYCSADIIRRHGGDVGTNALPAALEHAEGDPPQGLEGELATGKVWWRGFVPPSFVPSLIPPRPGQGAVGPDKQQEAHYRRVSLRAGRNVHENSRPARQGQLLPVQQAGRSLYSARYMLAFQPLPPVLYPSVLDP